MKLIDYFKYMEEKSGIDLEPTWLVDTDIDKEANEMNTIDVGEIDILKDVFESIIIIIYYYFFFNLIKIF